MTNALFYLNLITALVELSLLEGGNLKWGFQLFLLQPHWKYNRRRYSNWPHTLGNGHRTFLINGHNSFGIKLMI